MRTVVISMIVASMVIGGLAGAVDAPERPALPAGESWNDLSPDEQAALKRRFERFKNLSPEQQERLRARWQKFKKLSPEKRQAIRDGWRSFRGMSAEHRELMKKRHARWQKMPPERREKIRKKVQERFRKMSDEQLAEFFRNMSAWRTLPDKERQATFQRYLEIRKQHREERAGRPEGTRRRRPNGANGHPAETRNGTTDQK